MRNLLYSILVTLAVASFVPATVWLTHLGRRRRAERATRRARWETYTEIVGGGRARVGVALVARSGWAYHRATRLRCDTTTAEFAVDDPFAAVEAQVAATLRAEAYNSAIHRPGPDTG